jgi:hypothetical protein
VQRTVRGGPVPPFSGATVEVLAGHADGLLDISDPGTWLRSPEAVQAVLAERFGWDVVRGPGTLTWHEAKLSLQLIAEERFGAHTRRDAYTARAKEDAVWEAAMGNVPR